MKVQRPRLMPITTMLTLAFILLRITDTIDWSWWWVVSPLLFYVGLTIFILLALIAAPKR